MAARLPAGVCPPHAARLGRRPPPWRTGAPDAVRGPPAPAAVWPFKRSPAPPAVPGVSFVDSLANPGATVDAAAVAALWRDAAPMPCVSGDSDARVATALAGTWAWIAAYDEEGGGGGGDAPAPLIGFARLLSDGVFAALLSDVAVAPAHRNRGIGRYLVTRAVAAGKGAGAGSVVAFVPPGRPRLFLQRAGFRVSVAYRMLRHEGKDGGGGKQGREAESD